MQQSTMFLSAKEAVLSPRYTGQDLEKDTAALLRKLHEYGEEVKGTFPVPGEALLFRGRHGKGWGDGIIVSGFYPSVQRRYVTIFNPESYADVLPTVVDVAQIFADHNFEVQGIDDLHSSVLMAGYDGSQD